MGYDVIGLVSTTVRLLGKREVPGLRKCLMELSNMQEHYQKLNIFKNNSNVCGFYTHPRVINIIDVLNVLSNQ